MQQKVFILGASGNVWTTLIKQIAQYDQDGIKNINPTHIVGMANSKYMFVHDRGLSKKLLLWLKEKKDIKEFLKEKGEKYSNNEEILEKIKLYWYFGELIIIDVTADKNIVEFHKKILSNKYCFKLVTANKNPVSLVNQETFDSLTNNHGIYDYNTAVMAWGWVVNEIRRAINAHDTIQSIEGCFSGTLGYIASKLEEGIAFSEVVKDAYEKWYTEPNPWDDLNGLDVARKLIILVRTAGYNVEMKDIKVEPFIDKKYAEVQGGINDFLKAIQKEDKNFSEKYKEASKKWNTFKYVASMQKIKGKLLLQVALKEVPLNSQIGSLKGTSNITVIYTDIYKDEPHVIIAPWAGLEKTARGLRDAIADMIPIDFLR